MSMVIGVPKETHRHEHRVGLTPFAVARLTREVTPFVERGGCRRYFGDRDFQKAGPHRL
jgi:alanine dehydrogenase